MSIKDGLFTGLALVLIIYLTVAELEYREVNINRIELMNRFMLSGSRFTAQQGMVLCHHLRALQVEHKYVQPVDCGAVVGGE